jgi:adenylylsulfate kinase-like enzyme
VSIYLDNDWEYEINVTRKNTASGTVEAADSLSGITGRISLTSKGATINAALTKTLAERSSTAGKYFAIVDGDDLRTHLAAYVGQSVYEIIGDGTSVEVSRKHTVHNVRKPGT